MHVRRCRGLLFWASRFSLAELAQKGSSAAAAELLVGFPKPPPQAWEERESTEHEDAIEDFEEEATKKPAKSKRKSQGPRKPRVEGVTRKPKAPKATKAPTVSPLQCHSGCHSEYEAFEQAPEQPPQAAQAAQDVLWSRLGFSPCQSAAPEPSALPFPALSGARKRRMEDKAPAAAPAPEAPEAKELCGGRKEQARQEGHDDECRMMTYYDLL